jgi:peptidoglycan/xylan/chitin deacetylase (PgdA/CDA1 family)
MDEKSKKVRKTVGTRDAAAIYGASMGRIRQLVAAGEIWSIETADGRRYDADELRKLRATRDSLRASGKLGGQRPRGFSAC